MTPKFWTQGVYTKERVPCMEKWRGTNVVSLCHQISAVLTQEITPSLRNHSSSLDPISSPKVRSIKGCFGPQVSWNQSLMLTHPYGNKLLSLRSPQPFTTSAIAKCSCWMCITFKLTLTQVYYHSPWTPGHVSSSSKLLRTNQLHPAKHTHTISNLYTSAHIKF